MWPPTSQAQSRRHRRARDVRPGAAPDERARARHRWRRRRRSHRDFRTDPDDPAPSRGPLPQVAAAVALWITAAYWFTSSTSFANPAVTFARSLTNTFAGIAPNHVLPFVASQLIGVVLALLILRYVLLYRDRQ